MIKKENFTVNAKLKRIYANVSELDTTEKEIVAMYIQAGYILHQKPKRKNWTKNDMKAYIEKNETDDNKKKANLEKIADKKTSYFDLRKWFFETYKEAKAKKESK